MGAFRKELVADVQLLLGADAHECFDIRLLQRTENVVDFLHGSLLRRGELTEPLSRASGVSSRPVAPPVPRGMGRDDQVGEREDRREVARSATGAWQVAEASTPA